MLVASVLVTGLISAGFISSDLVGGDLAASAASTPVSATTTSTTTTTGELQVTMLAAPAASGIARPGEPLSVRVTITNDGTTPTPELTLALEIEGNGPAAPVALEQWLAGEATLTDAQTAASATLSPIDPGSSAVLDLIVPADRAAASGAFGPRQVEVTASAGTERIVTERTAIVWVPGDTAPPTSRTVFVAPLSTPGVAQGLLDAETLALLTAETGDLSRQLSAVAGRPVMVAIDPRIIASIRLLGADAPASATGFLERLAAIPNETTLLPWADADPVAALAGGGVISLPEGVTTDPAAENEGGDGAAAPSDLLAAIAWPASLTDLFWIENTLPADLLGGLRDAGARALIVPSTALAGREVAQQVEGLRLVRADAALSTAAREASAASSQQLYDRAIARVSALLAAQAASETEAIAVIALSRDELPSSDRLIDTIARTLSLPWSSASTVSAALTGPAAEATLVGEPVDEELQAAVVDALGAESADRAFAAIATNPARITDARRLELLAALSLGWGTESITALEGFVAESQRLRAAVRVAESSAITLLADRVSLPVTVQNDLDVPVRVYVQVDPDSTQLRVLDSRVEVLVEPRSQTRALVPVESLTNGQVGITVSLRDAAGNPIGASTRVSLNLQAGWETAGTIAVAAGVVLLLVVGISRDIRKRRRAVVGDGGEA